MAGEETIGRTITKRDVQMKIIKYMIEKGRDVMNRDDHEAELVKNKYRDSYASECEQEKGTC